MKRILNTFILGVAIVGMSSCLKDKNVNLAGDDSPAVVEWSTTLFTTPSSPATSTYSLYTRDLSIAPSASFELTVNLTGTEAASDDITLQLGVNTPAVAAYNKERLDVDQEVTNFVAMPANLYSMPTSVVIPKGSNKAKITLTFKTDQFDFNTAYALPISIVSASNGVTVSGNYGTILLNVGAKNKYDGVYKLVGRLSGVTDRSTANTTSDFTWPGNFELRTTSANSVGTFDTNFNWGGGIAQWILPFATTTGYSAYGQVRPNFVLNLTTNQITSVNNAITAPTNGRQLVIDPSYAGTYNPTTKVFETQFIMTQPGFQPLTIHYKFTFVRSR